MIKLRSAICAVLLCISCTAYGGIYRWTSHGVTEYGNHPPSGVAAHRVILRRISVSSPQNVHGSPGRKQHKEVAHGKDMKNAPRPDYLAALNRYYGMVRTLNSDKHKRSVYLRRKNLLTREMHGKIRTPSTLIDSAQHG